MPDAFKDYMNIILAQRNWSWTIIGIIYLILGLVIRGWFLRPLLVQARGLSREIYSDIKRKYLRLSFTGWVFFFIPLAILVVLWSRSPVFPAVMKGSFFILFAVASYILSILLHLKAFGIATITALKQSIDKGMPREF